MEMTQQEKKHYILNNWRTSDGKRIAEMLRRFWLPERVDSYKFADQLFNGNKTEQIS